MKSIYLLAMIAMASIGLTGCNQEPAVRVYTVKKEAPKKVRILGAIIAHGDEGIFIKGMGPPEKLEPFVQSLKKIVQDSKVTAGVDPEWVLPETWKILPGDQVAKNVFAATDGDVKVNFTVTHLPNSVGAWEEYVTTNVNRWRGQVSLPKATLEEQAKELTILTRPDVPTASYLVDLLGTPGSGGPMGGMGSGPMAQAPPRKSQEPESPLKFKTPEGWVVKGGASQFRLASFGVKEGDQVGEGSISLATNNIQENGMMWQQQIAADAPDAEMKAAVESSIAAGEPIESSLGSGKIYLFKQNDQPTADSILIAVIPIEGSEGSLFVKLRGSLQLVQAQKLNLMSLVQSLRIEGA